MKHLSIKQRIGIIILFAGIFWGNQGYAQSYFTLSGGFNQSIFYCGQKKKDYSHSFTPYNSYLITFSYRENLSAYQKNMQVGAQLEFKQQSSWFSYQDLYPQDTISTGVQYDIMSINLYLFPELKVGERVSFVFSGGPIIQYIINVKAEGKQINLKTGEPNIETEIKEKSSKDISGISIGGKINFGIEIPIHKNIYLTFNNGYSFGLTGMKGNLSKRMKFFNCVDINLSGGVIFQLNHVTKKSYSSPAGTVLY